MIRAESRCAAVKSAANASSTSTSGAEGATEPDLKGAIVLREPRDDDGAHLHQLVAACPPLDPNSLYCNLLQCTHFRGTSVAAERDGELVGFISGYIPPEQPDTLFIWQVAVHGSTRGQGVGKRMLKALLARPQCGAVRYLDTTVTPGNQASRAMFDSLARDLGAAVNTRVLFDRERHFGGAHDSEELLRIGPFAAGAIGSSDTEANSTATVDRGPPSAG